MINNLLSILVVSCDKYSDIWEVYIKLFNKYWPECKYERYLLTNKIETQIFGFRSIAIGDDISWSDNLKKGLEKIRSKYVLILIDDHFIVDKVNDEELNNILKYFYNIDGNYLRLYPYPRPIGEINKFMGSIPEGYLYRTSVISSVWKINVLYDILKEGENAWQFELNGSIRSDKYNGFYAIKNINILPTINGIIRGKWNKMAMKILENKGIIFNQINRPIMSNKEMIIYYYSLWRSKIFNFIPWKLRRRIREIFKLDLFGSSPNDLKNRY